tara:strand:- start:233 stop:442 length:210 start_codon:yes stop_codon:yes gene_type:complete
VSHSQLLRQIRLLHDVLIASARLGNGHDNTVESIECNVVPKGEVAFPAFAALISILFFREFVLQNGNKK